MLRRQSLRLVFCVVALAVLPLGVPAQQNGERIDVATPLDVDIVQGQTLVVVTGPPTGESTLQCLLQPQHQHNAVALDPGGAHAAQRTEIVIHRLTEEEPVRLGTRFRITGGPGPCNTQYQTFTGEVE